MRSVVSVVAIGAVLSLSPVATAHLIIDLGGGWQATIHEVNQLDLTVDFVSVEDDILVLEKFADFLSIDQSLDIIFEQIAPDEETVSQIVLTDEFVFNNTGVDWSGFRMDLLGDNVAFDPVDSADFSIDPFTTTSYNPGNTTVEFGGGTLPAGGIWTPGLDSGGLYIDVDLSGDNPVVFALSETAIPAPGAIVLLGLAGVMARGRRRR